MFRDQDATKGSAPTWSKDHEEGEEGEEGEEENTDTSPEQSLEEAAAEEELQTAEPEGLEGESKAAGEQEAAEVSEPPATAQEEGSDDGPKRANGMGDINSKSQSGSSKKLSLFRRLSFTRSKHTDHSPAGGAAPRGEPASSLAGSVEPKAPQRALPSGARGPHSGACSLLFHFKEDDDKEEEEPTRWPHFTGRV
ncbi:uncharacterized protein AB9W97_007408 [Spinachia spinachia]